MPKGLSLHIGLNTVDQEHYKGLVKPLFGAVNDARDMADIAQNTFRYEETELLLEEAATAERVLDTMARYAKAAQPGDLFLLTYSGHGSQVDALDDSEEDAMDETWCLYGRMLLDNELYEAFRHFDEGVRITVLSDSCHSGTVTRIIPGIGEDVASLMAEQEQAFNVALKELLEKFNLRSKDLPADKGIEVYDEHIDTYEALQESLLDKGKAAEVVASVKLFSACQDNQKAIDTFTNGRFTTVVKRVIESGEWRRLASPRQFYDALRRPFSYPTPNFFEYGGRIEAFEYSFPLAIK